LGAEQSAPFLFGEKQLHQRAYGILEVKSVDDDQRIINGIASSPTPDRYGDIVEPMGAKFKLPLPLLWQHKSDTPVGTVEFAEPGKGGIPFRAKMARIDEPGELKNSVDKAWQAVKAGLVRGVSIGFTALDHAFLKDGSGIHFKEWEWLELSLVTIPANSEATISNIKSIDTELRASSGNAWPVYPETAAVVAPPKPIMRKAKTMAKKTIAEQIAAYEATRAANTAKMAAIMEESGDAGETLDGEQKETFDNLDREVAEVDAHLKRLDALQRVNVAAAKPVDAPANPEQASNLRAGLTVSVKAPAVEKGTAFTRYVLALARAKGSRSEAWEIARGNEQWMAETPQVATVLKAAVNAGTTTDPTWAGALTETTWMSSEFVEYLRPMTILGRIPGLRRVPFNIKLPRQTGGSTTGWVGEGDPKPVSGLTFDTVTLRFTKAAGIVVLTDELVRFSNPSAESIVRQDLAEQMAKFLDEQFVDPSIAAVTDVSPASITNGASTDAASGTTADDVREDFAVALSHFAAAEISTSGLVMLMRPTTALGLGMMSNPLGQPEFGAIGPNGGTLFGSTIITSNSVTAGQVIFLQPGEIWLADDGVVTVDASREASLQMNTDPSVGDYQTVSLWQTNMVGIRAERWVHWKRRRDAAVYYITGANYGVGGSV
jgi:HK97 family phage major capsid protein/HK97 family phage prohead protease